MAVEPTWVKAEGALMDGPARTTKSFRFDKGFSKTPFLCHGFNLTPTLKTRGARQLVNKYLGASVQKKRATDDKGKRGKDGGVHVPGRLR